MPSPVLASVVTTLRAAGCVFAEDEAELIFAAARTPAEVTAMVDRRVAGEPLELVVGWAEFHGLRITVEPGVFFPAAVPSSSSTRPSPTPPVPVWSWTCAAARARSAPPSPRRWTDRNCTPPT